MAKTDPAADTPLTPRPVLIVLTQGYADWETPLIAAAASDFYGLKVRHATPGGGDVTSMGGLHVTGLPDLSLLPDEIVVVCGGNIWTTDSAPKIGPFLRKAHDDGHVIAGICAGVIPMARAGLLDKGAHSTNGLPFMDHYVPGYAGRARHQDTSSAVSDAGIITAAGTAPLTFALEVLKAAGVPSLQRGEMRQMLLAETRD